MKPLILAIFPPVYDFALYDLYIKPYSLLLLGNWFKGCGYRVKIINCLDYHDPASLTSLGKPRRKKDGTGKFFRQVIPKPGALQTVPRNFARYGILQEVIRSLLTAEKPDLILVAGSMTYWYPGIQEVVRLAKSVYPQVPVVVGGIYATLCREHCLQTIPADYIISGDAFPALTTILAKLHLPWNHQPIKDPLLLAEIYSDAAILRINKGCPFRCQYCSSHALAKTFTQGNPEQAFNLVRAIHTQLGTRNFAFYDDALLVKKEEVFLPFLEKIIASGMPLQFYLPNAIHLAFMDRQTACLMKRAGFRELRIGFESASSRFHTSLDNKLDPAGFREKINLLLAAGFKPAEIGLYILAGLPGQYRAEVEDSIRFAAGYGVNVYLAEYSPIPGSLLWEKSIALSPFPLAAEPLWHNNSLLPLRWSGFTMQDLQELKELSWQLCRNRVKPE